jgi:hypothetical protein
MNGGITNPHEENPLRSILLTEINQLGEQENAA